MATLLLVVHVMLAIGLIGLVLIQHGKGADAGAAFGSGASSTVFGSRGSTSFLSRATAVLATLFFVVSLALAILANQPAETGSVTDIAQEQPAAQGPASAPEGASGGDVPSADASAPAVPPPGGAGETGQ